MSFEENYYENMDLWDRTAASEADCERVATVARKVPADVRTVLDVGCGNGIFLHYLGVMKEHPFTRLCGADRSTIALSTVHTEQVKASIDSLPFTDGEFDAVACMEVLEHLPEETFQKAIHELSRVARRYILVTVPYNENLRLGLTECVSCGCRFHPYNHVRSFNHHAMSSLFNNHGFRCGEVFTIHRENGIPNILKLMNRFQAVTRQFLFHHPPPQMVPYSVCPACGYSLRHTDAEAYQKILHQKNRVRNGIRTLFFVKRTWRWIGALYERDTDRLNHTKNG